MWDVIWKAASFLLVICAGYILRQRGVFGPKEYTVVQRIVMNLTIPAAIIVSFNGFQMDAALLGVAVLGLGMNLGMIALAALFSWRKSRNDKVLWMMSFCGYNVGCFALPFLQNFLGGYGVALACLFDVGNSTIATGGGYAIVSNLVDRGEGSGFSLKDMGKKLLHVVPFVTYLFMILYTAVGLKVPQTAVTLLTPAANANAFVSMLFIGMMVDFHMEPGDGVKALKLVGLRAAVSILVAAGLYFLLPVGLETRRVLAILALSPIAVLSASFTADLNGPTAMAASVNSIYAVFSVVAMSVLVVLFGIS